MIIHIGDVEQPNTLPDDVGETIGSSARRNRRKPIGARTVGGRRLKLNRGITMDFKASANVIPRRMAMSPSRIRPSPGSVAGVKYVAANDGISKTLSEYVFNFSTAEGQDEVACRSPRLTKCCDL